MSRYFEFLTRQLFLTCSFCAALVRGLPRKNVLFIVVDDMRPSIGAFNFSLARTPNMDKLAREGLTFKRTYVQYAFCAPSRNSFMSGRRPDTTRVWNFMDDFRQEGVGANWVSMPEYFKIHGYVTMTSGKTFHPGVPANNDFPKSWSEEYPYFSPECTPESPGKCLNSSASGPPNGKHNCIYADPPGNPTLCVADTKADEDRFEFQLEDQKIRDSCISQLETASKTGKNFFIGCGFHKPHVPWIVPSEFLEQFPPWEDIPLPKFGHAPEGMPDAAWHFPADVNGFNIKFNGSCNETRTRIFRRGYYAAVSYTDYNIGKLVDALDGLGLSNNTAVIVFGDHGWQLGEHDTWAKMTNFEIALRTPTIVRAPWLASSVGRVTDVLAEAVDFYPTLAALAGLPDPRSMGEEINGTSLLPVFKNPSDTSIKSAAFSQFAKPSRSDPFLFWPTPERSKTEIMGYSVRVDAWRYTVWFGFDGNLVVPKTDDILGRELYSHSGDDGDADFLGETVNVADDSSNAEVVDKLHAQILQYIQLFPQCVEVQPPSWWRHPTCAGQLKHTSNCEARLNGTLHDGFCSMTCSLCCADVQPPSSWDNPTCHSQLKNRPDMCEARRNGSRNDGYCYKTCGVCGQPPSSDVISI